ncbi:MAG: endonuclease/exonuclease/phosphatase family protein [Bacteroidota bacterium]|nr:endonuclease/exonuclease/phosphatase family protein [Bacteroidota bacterium]
MAKSVLRRLTKTILIFLNGVIAFLFLIACLSPYINPANWWLNGFTGLIVPYLILLLLFFLIFWLIVKPALSLLPLLTLVLGWQQLGVVFAWHPGEGFTKEKKADAWRFVDWNVQSFHGLTNNKEVRKLIPGEVVASILKQDPDVICLQEFNNAANANNISLFGKNFPYHYFSRDYLRAGKDYQSGCIILSRFPIVDTGKIRFPLAESLIYADIKRGEDTIRVFTTHLQSFKFVKTDYTDIEKIRDQEDENLMASKSIFRKMKLAFSRRGIQANMVRTEMDKSPHPSVICGDFNDVPNSYTYFHIRGNRQDAFLEKGFAIGRSFVSLAPTLRIDFVLPDQQFAVSQFDMVDEDLSDHIMLVTDLVLKK